MKKILLLFLVLFILLISCSKRIEKDTVMYAKTSVSSVNTIIGDTIEYEVRIVSKKNIEYKFEDVSFDDRNNKCRIISVENKNKDIGEYKERIIKYQIGFYDVGQFVIYPFKVSYNYNNKYEELYGEDVAVLVYPFSDGEILPPMKSTIGLKMKIFYKPQQGRSLLSQPQDSAEYASIICWKISP